MGRIDTVRKKLQGNPKYNPFNKNYTPNELEDFIEKHKKDDDVDIYGISIASTTTSYNLFYTEIMSYIKDKAQLASNNYWDIIRTLLTLANRDYYLLNRMAVFDKSVSSIYQMANLEVESSIEHFHKMNVISAIENSIDISNIIINVLRHSIDSSKGCLILEENKTAEVVRMYAAANILHYIKESYDTALWENGYIITDDNCYYVKYIDEEYPIARRIGDIRMNNNILGILNIIEDLAEENKAFNETLFMKKRKTQILQNAWIDSKGYIKYSLKQETNNAKSESLYAMAISELNTYYPFISGETFNSINDLCLDDLVIMFSKLAILISNINDKYMADGIDDKKISNFLYKIKVRELLHYLKETTEFCKKQIESFFELIESNFENKARINLWSRPVLRVGDTFYFLSVNIIAPNFAFLVDDWLDSIGYDLKKRGTDFERYIKKELDKCLSQQDFYFKIPDKSKFYINEKDYEEIDLLINLKSIVIIGEVKCIKYPIDSRDSYNNLNRLRDASEQIKRKANYIWENRNFFINDFESIENKKIIKVIITNYPIFAGTIVEGIPVIDYYLFDSYIRSGKLTHFAKIRSEDNSSWDDTSEVISYYSCEDEFCANFGEFIYRPLSISEIRNNLSMKSRELTLPESSIHIFQDFAEDVQVN